MPLLNVPHDLELPISTSNCSLDVSVLSVGSSWNSFGSMHQAKKSKSKKKVHRKSPSTSKFSPYNGTSRWHNPVDSFGSTGMTFIPSRKGSNGQLRTSRVQPGTRQLDSNRGDVAASMPTRKRSNTSVARGFKGRYKHRNDSKIKNFEWKRIKPSQAISTRSLPCPSKSGYGFDYVSPNKTNLALKQTSSSIMPPPIPSRKASLNDMESCSKNQPPDMPSRKASLMDMENAEAENPATSNSFWSSNGHTEYVKSKFADCPSMSQTSKSLFMTMPPITSFERASSRGTESLATYYCSPPSRPSRRGSAGGQSTPTNTAKTLLHTRLVAAPTVPQRKTSLMDISYT